MSLSDFIKQKAEEERKNRRINGAKDEKLFNNKECNGALNCTDNDANAKSLNFDGEFKSEKCDGKNESIESSINTNERSDIRISLKKEVKLTEKSDGKTNTISSNETAHSKGKTIKINKKIKLNRKEKSLDIPTSDINETNISSTDKSISINAKKFEENDEGKSMEKLFLESETPEEYRMQWVAAYEKAQTSNRNNFVNRKVKSGRFRYDLIDGVVQMEILADMTTAGKSSKDLLNISWEINGGNDK